MWLSCSRKSILDLSFRIILASHHMVKSRSTASLLCLSLMPVLCIVPLLWGLAGRTSRCTWLIPKQVLFFFMFPPSSVHSSGPRPSQSARRCFYQWQAPTQPYSPQDRGDGPSWHPAMRHLPPAPSVSWLCLQDSLQVPGDRLHKAGGHWGQQTQGEYLRKQSGDG